MVEIRLVEEHKKEFLPLLLLGDEEERMIDRYLERGALFVLYDETVKGICVVTEEKDAMEIKNLAVEPEHQGKGYGRALVDYVCEIYKGKAAYMLVGTGDSPRTVPFYKICGFEESHRVPNFFTTQYDHPIWEDGHLLRDMVYFRRPL